MKILIIGNLNTIFTFEFIKEILCSMSDYQIDVYSYTQKEQTRVEILEFCNKNNIRVFYTKKGTQRKFKFLEKLPHPIVLLSNIVRFRICKNYDVIHMHGIPVLAPFIAIYAHPKTRLIMSYYGSDLLRASNYILRFQNIALRRSNVITVATGFMRDKFNAIYNDKFKDKVVLQTYGSNNADSIIEIMNDTDVLECKNKFNIPNNKVAILCGYNGSRGQQHISILNLLSMLSDNDKEKIYLLCHCSYGVDDTYIDEIAQALERTGIEGRIITEYITGERMAQFRLSTDIMLNLQVSDAFSASMLECIEAGAVVINGAWLKYPELLHKGTFMLSITDMSVLPTMLSDVVNNIDSYKNLTCNNKGVLYEFLSWKPKREKWINIVTGKQISN